MNDMQGAGDILIVEDTPASLKLLSDLLSRAGYNVRQAPDGELALWSVQARAPELILLDVRMPGVDGFEVCRRLKQDPATRDIPVIFLSAQFDTEDKVQGFRAGAIDFIGKPYQSEEVLARTSAHLALSRSQRALAASNAELTATIGALQAAREALRRAERLAALGSMVAGMAHELNTPIGNCLMSASTLEQRTQDFGAAADAGLRRSDVSSFVADASQASAIMMRNLRAAAELIVRFKEVATDQASVARQQFALDTMLASVAAVLAARMAAAGVRLEIGKDTGISMDSYPGALGEVLGHLVSNALVHGFAGGAKGTVSIRARLEGETVVLAVCDDGAGIDSAHIARVFDPFFTTRMGQGGGGLGLNIAHNLVTNVLGGTIDVASRPGATCFELRCPRIAPLFD